jgi:hypothetical protein
MIVVIHPLGSEQPDFVEVFPEIPRQPFVLVERRRADAQIATDLRSRQPRFRSFQRFHDLAVREFRPLHAELPLSRKFYFRRPLFHGGGDYPTGGRSTAFRYAMAWAS